MKAEPNSPGSKLGPYCGEFHHGILKYYVDNFPNVATSNRKDEWEDEISAKRKTDDRNRALPEKSSATTGGHFCEVCGPNHQ